MPGQTSFLDDLVDAAESGPRVLTFGSLFAGIGGLDLGLERAGLRCSWQVEIDPFCRRVLEKHWPDVARHDDVRTFPQGDPAGWKVDAIVGGFPCQDISYAGKGAGLEGERSGLWDQFARVVRDLRPEYVLVENVAALLARGLHSVLGDLAAIGYDAEWHCLPAAYVGAPHIRDRIFLLGHPSGGAAAADAERGLARSEAGEPGGSGGPGLGRDRVADLRARQWVGDGGQERFDELCRDHGGGFWSEDPADAPKSQMGRMAHGVPGRVDRLRALGNAVVPQVAEFLGRQLVEFDEARVAQRKAEAPRGVGPER